MILTCPQCATRYFLPDVKLGPGGRAVKCTSCGNTWRAQAEAPPEPAPPLVPPPPPPPPPEPEPAAEPEDEFAAATARRAEIQRERKAEIERKARQSAVVAGGVWAGLAAAVAILLVLAAVFRAKVVEYWPGAASAYAAVGLPVNASGLVIDYIQATPQVLGAQRSLLVSGAVTNAASTPKPSPGFHVRVLDRSGVALAEQIIGTGAPPIGVHQTQRFSLTVANPPAGYESVEVTLAPPRAPPTPIPAPAPAAAPRQAALPPVIDAKPLTTPTSSVPASSASPAQAAAASVAPRAP